ncbi:hypothetical protein Cgig2_032946 [Carnegiea gigantea]|uniref:Annexin n=1 Tax=Carnegiea gigantea TaxID=171969 RepID=A0A9Q1JGI5_9CARY|nr:hypothetical protein Cgig2_032946 [Carnegiea gigantea]
MTTVVASESSSPFDDAQVIKEACLGLGTDEKAIIQVLGHRNSNQIKLIRQAYQELYQEDLIHQLKSELSGDFLKAICLWVMDPTERDAALAHQALEKGKPNYKLILEIVCTKSPEELLTVKRTYHSIHKRALEEDIASHTNGKIRKALRGDSDNEFFTVVRASIRCIKYPQKYFAKVLHNAIKGLGTDEDALSRVIVTRAEIDLKEIKNLYFDRNNVSLEQAAAEDTSSDYRTFLLTLLGSEGY